MGPCRWVQLAYPFERWVAFQKFYQKKQSKVYPKSHHHHNGTDRVRADFKWFCEVTDGFCPWAEWYEPAKFMRLVAPARFDLAFCGIAGRGIHAVNWMEYTFLGMDDAAAGSKIARLCKLSKQAARSLKGRSAHDTEHEIRDI
eukprot:gene54940-65879_t